MKDVRLNNGTTMTDEQFVMERGMGDTITDFVATKADLEVLARELAEQVCFDDYCRTHGGISKRDRAHFDYTEFRLRRVADFAPEQRAEIEEKLRLDHIQNEADAQRLFDSPQCVQPSRVLVTFSPAGEEELTMLRIKINGAPASLFARHCPDGVWDLRCLDPLVGEFLLRDGDTPHLWSQEFGYWLRATGGDLVELAIREAEQKAGKGKSAEKT
jgi:hypothetical protein